MDATSRSCSPPTESKPPELFVRLASDDERLTVYADRAPCFKGSLGVDEYISKQLCGTGTAKSANSRRTLDKRSANRYCKTVWVLIAADDPECSSRASLEVYAREAFWKRSKDAKVTTRTAAYIGSLFVPMRFRGHGYARLILRQVVAMLRGHVLPAPLDDVALVFGSTDPDLERVYTRAQWHRFTTAYWTLDAVPNFSARGQLPATEPIYDYEIDELLRVASGRVSQAVAESSHEGPTFAIVPNANQARVRLASVQLDWRRKRTAEEHPGIVGARIGSSDEPAGLSFAIWGLRFSDVGIRIYFLSATDDRARLALYAAATEAARDLGGKNVSPVLSEPSTVTDVVPDIALPVSVDYGEGTVLLDPDCKEATCHWLHRACLDDALESDAHRPTSTKCRPPELDGRSCSVL